MLALFYNVILQISYNLVFVYTCCLKVPTDNTVYCKLYQPDIRKTL